MQLLKTNVSEKLFLFFIATITLVAVIVPFIFLINPGEERSLRLDQQRVSAINDLSYHIQEYFNTYETLPVSLDVMETSERLIDPETKKPYDYKQNSQTSYSLCTTFSTDSSQHNQTFPVGQIFKKGYSCLNFTVRYEGKPTNPVEWNYEEAIPQ